MLLAIQYVIQYILIIMIALKFQNFNQNSTSTNSLQNVLYDLQLYHKYESLINDSESLCLILYCITAYLTTIIASSFLLLLCVDSSQSASHNSYTARFLSLMLQVQTKILFSLEIWIVANALMLCFTKIIDLRLLLTSIIIALELILIEGFQLRLFNLRIKNEKVSWSQSNTLHFYINLAMKIFIASSHLIPNLRTQICINTLFSLANHSTFLFFLPQYDFKLQHFELFLSQTHFLFNFTFFLFINLEVESFMIESALVFSLLSYGLLNLSLKLRKITFFTKYQQNQLKNILAIEKFLYILFNCLDNYETQIDSQNFLLQLLWFHKKNCFKNLNCKCHKMFSEESSEDEALQPEVGIHQQEEVSDILNQNSSSVVEKKDKRQEPTIINRANDKVNTQSYCSQNNQFEKFNLLNKLEDMEVLDDFNSLFENKARVSKKIVKKNQVEQNCPIQNFEELLAQKGLKSSYNHHQTLKTLLLIIYDMIKDFDSQFDQKNQAILCLKAYYELYHLQNKFLSHSTITRLNQLNLGLLNYTMMLVDSQFLLDEAESLYKADDTQKLDMQSVIDQNSLISEFFTLSDEISQETAQFWTRLYKQNANMHQLYQDGIKVSRLIRKIVNKFNKIEDKTRRNFQIYYHYSCFQKYILNNDDLSELYLQKMERMRDLKRASKNIYYQEKLSTEPDEAGFVIVKATFKEFGQILFINNTASKLLGYENNYLVSKQINAMMPNIISENHSKFWRKFNEFGIPSFIERDQHLFVKNSEGYIFPVLAFVKFNHDKQFGHTFIAIINQVKYMQPFKNQRQYELEELMVIMTDDKGSIIEVNQTVNDVISLSSSFVEQNQRYIQDALKIDQVLNMDLTQFTPLSGFESTCSITETFLTQLVGNQIKLGSIDQSLHTNFNLNINNSQSQNRDYLTIRMMTQVYKDGILTVKYFFIGLNEKAQEKRRNSMIGLVTKTLALDENYAGNNESSVSSSNQVSRNQREIDNLISEGKTPRMLRLITQLVTLIIMIMISISTANLAKFLVATTKAENQISIASEVLNRMLYTTKAINLMRCFLTIQQQEFNTTLYDPVLQALELQQSGQLNNLLQNKIINTIDSIKEKQTIIDQNYYLFEDNQEITSMKNQNKVRVWGIRTDGTTVQNYQTLNTAINIFVENAQAIVSYEFNPQKYNRQLIFDTLENQFIRSINTLRNGSSLQTILNLEKDIYSFFKTGIYELKMINEEEATNYIEETLIQFTGDNNLALVMMIISVCSIFVIIIAIIPNFSKIENRKYNMLSFFYQLSNEIVFTCKERSEVFEEQFYNYLEEEAEEIERFQNITRFKENLKDLIKPFNQAEVIQIPKSDSEQLDDKSQNQPGEDYDDTQEDLLMDFEINKSQKAHQKQRKTILSHVTHKSLNENQHSTDFNYKKLGPPKTVVIQKRESIRSKIDFQKPKPQMRVSFAVPNFLEHQKIGGIKVNSKEQKQTQIQNLNNQIQHLFENFDKKVQESSDQNKFLNLPKQGSKNLNNQEEQKVSINSNSRSFSQQSSSYLDQEEYERQFQQKQSQFKGRRKSIHSLRDQNFGKTLARLKQTIDNSKKANSSQSDLLSQDITKSIHSEAQSSSMVQIEAIENEQAKQETLQIQDELAKNLPLSNQENIIKITVYILANTTFEQIQLGLYDLKNLYFRTYCISETLITYREEILMNVTNSKLTSKAVINNCLQHEDQFMKMKRMNPDYFDDIKYLITQMDSEDLCRLSVDYKNDNYFSIESCQNIYNGLFKNGLSKINQVIYQLLLMKSLDFEGKLMKLKNYQYLLQKFEDDDLLLFIYSTEFVLDGVNRKLLSQAFNSIANYQESMKKIYIIIFSLMCFFILLGLIVFIFFAFKRMKMIMINCNNLLKILPLAYLDAKTQKRLKKFIIN